MRYHRNVGSGVTPSSRSSSQVPPRLPPTIAQLSVHDVATLCVRARTMLVRRPTPLMERKPNPYVGHDAPCVQFCKICSRPISLLSREIFPTSCGHFSLLIFLSRKFPYGLTVSLGFHIETNFFVNVIFLRRYDDTSIVFYVYVRFSRSLVKRRSAPLPLPTLTRTHESAR